MEAIEEVAEAYLRPPPGSEPDGPHAAEGAAEAEARPAAEVAAAAAALGAAARDAQRVSKVTYGDPHLDAKLFPVLHPYGSGSRGAEEGPTGIQRLARARLLDLDDTFRKTPVYPFYQNDRLLKNELFFQERKRRGRAGHNIDAAAPPLGGAGAPAPQAQPGRPAAAPQRGRKRKRGEEEAPPDAGARGDAEGETLPPSLFGRTEPKRVVESRAWWEDQQKSLSAMTEEHELGMMNAMVTITQNDRSPEILAWVRRGPLASPTEEETGGPSGREGGQGGGGERRGWVKGGFRGAAWTGFRAGWGRGRWRGKGRGGGGWGREGARRGGTRQRDSPSPAAAP